ncbi:MAG: PcfJ domain-containing protein [Ruminococcus sp.]
MTGFYGNIVHIELDSKINWKSNNLLKMLHLNRTEFAVLKGRETYYDAYIAWRNEMPRYKPDELLLLAMTFEFDFGTAKHFCESTGLKPKRIAAYLSENKIEKHDYDDYIRQCRTLKLNLHDTAISMPHDFNAAHERLSEIINYESNQKLRLLMSGLYDSRRCLEFMCDGFVIKQPGSPEEIIREGRILHHCVGGYVERHAKGILNILFIRRTSDPDTPFYTMELSKNGNIVQVRGLRNCSMTGEVAEFVEKYKLYISKIFREKESKTA